MEHFKFELKIETSLFFFFEILFLKEFPQVSLASAKHFSKYAARPSSLSQIPFFVEKVFIYILIQEFC